MITVRKRYRRTGRQTDLLWHNRAVKITVGLRLSHTGIMQQFTCCFTTNCYGNGCYTLAELWNIYISSYHISSARPQNYIWQILVRHADAVHFRASRSETCVSPLMSLSSFSSCWRQKSSSVLIRQDVVSCGNGVEVVFILVDDDTYDVARVPLPLSTIGTGRAPCCQSRHLYRHLV